MSIETERRVAMLTNNKPTWPDDHVAKQRTEAHVEVASSHIHRSKAHLALPARWPYSEFGNSRRSGQLPHTKSSPTYSGGHTTSHMAR